MACSTSTVLLALMVVATTFILIDGQNTQVTITGTVTCSETGQGVAGISVSVTCNGDTTSLGSGVSVDKGAISFLLSVTNSGTFINFINKGVNCVATATFPAGQCSASASVTSAPLTLVSGTTYGFGTIAS